MNTRELKPAVACPKWCADDHTAQAGEDREHHNGPVRELRLPDGRTVIEASLTLEPDSELPQLVVSGSVESFAIDVQLLNLADAKAFEAEVQRFSAHLSRMTAVLQVAQDQRPVTRKGRPGKMRRAAWRETRLYLAERDGRCCFHCRTPFGRLKGVSIDHYIPKSVWQCNLPANLVLSCRKCNTRKQDRLTWSMAAVLLAWHAREGGGARERKDALEPVRAEAERASLASLTG